MSILAHDSLTQIVFSVHENRGVLALLLGSGLSRVAEIPTGWEITLDLIRRVALAQGVDDQPDWAAWYREKTGQEPDYSVLLEELAASPEERRSILHSYIEPTDEDREEGRKIPTAAHQAIADLVRSGHIRVIITTNFDRLMENALRERGIEPTIVASVDALSGAEPITHILARREGFSAIALKVGTLDTPALFGSPDLAIFTVDKQDFHYIPDDLPAFSGAPLAEHETGETGT